MLLPWYGRETNIAGAVVTESWTAWQSLSVVAVLLFAIGLAAVALPAGRALRSVPTGFRAARVLARLGLLGVVLGLSRLTGPPTAGIDLQSGDSVDPSREPALFLALLATLGIVGGGRRLGRAASAGSGPRSSR